MLIFTTSWFGVGGGQETGKKYCEKVKIFHFNTFGVEAKGGKEVFSQSYFQLSSYHLLSVTETKALGHRASLFQSLHSDSGQSRC